MLFVVVGGGLSFRTKNVISSVMVTFVSLILSLIVVIPWKSVFGVMSISSFVITIVTFPSFTIEYVRLSPSGSV